MASVVGSGAPCIASLPAPEEQGEAEVEEAPSSKPAVGAEDSPETTALFARLETALDAREDGFTLAELRVILDVPAKDLRLAIEVGLRTKALRRTGSHNSLRYLRNPRPNP